MLVGRYSLGVAAKSCIYLTAECSRFARIQYSSSVLLAGFGSGYD